MKNGLIICKNGDKLWYKNDLYHNENGPAIERSDGTKYWCIDGKNHRLDGPATERSDGRKYWWFEGQYIECSSQEEFEKIITKKYPNKKIFMKNGLIINKDGDKHWYKNDELHNENGPAIKYTNGYKAWFINDKRHRLDGPAEEFADGERYWWYENQEIECSSQEEFEKIITKKYPNKKIFMKNGLHIDQYGDKRWYKNGLCHNENGPAIEYINGDKYWYINDKLHRLDGPAREYASGYKEWYYENQYINCSSQEEFEKIISIKEKNKNMTNKNLEKKYEVVDLLTAYCYNNNISYVHGEIINSLLDKKDFQSLNIIFTEIDNLKKSTNEILKSFQEECDDDISYEYIKNTKDKVTVKISIGETEGFEINFYYSEDDSDLPDSLTGALAISGINLTATLKEIAKNPQNFISIPRPNFKNNSFLKDNQPIKGSQPQNSISYQEDNLPKEESLLKPMNSFIEIAKSDFEKAAYITAANQFTLATKEGILAAAKTTLNGDQLAILSKFIDSDLGKSALSYMLGQGLPLAPVIGQDPRIQQISESMRVNSIANGMNMLMGIVMTFVMPGILKAMESLPSLKKNSIETTGQEVPAEVTKLAKSKKKTTKVRVSAASKKELLLQEEEEEEIVNSKPKKARALF